MPEFSQGEDAQSLRAFDDITGRIHLTLQALSRTVILTEGKSDRSALKLIVEVSRILSLGSKSQLLETCAQLAALGDDGFVAVFDRDFDDLIDSELFLWRVYEGGDLEAAVLCSGVGEGLLENIVPDQKLALAGGAAVVFSEAVNAIKSVCRLRAASRQMEWGLPFDRIDIGRYIGADNLVDSRKVIAALSREYSDPLGRRLPGQEQLLASADAAVEVGHFRGRDLLCVLEKYMRSTRLRHRKGVDPNRESLEAMVHTAAPGALAATAWGRDLAALLG